MVNPQQGFSPYPLQKSEYGKPKHACERKQTQPVGDGIERHGHTCQVMHPLIERCKSDTGAHRTDRTDIRQTHQDRPQNKCRKNTSCGEELLEFRVSHVFKPSFGHRFGNCRFYDTAWMGKTQETACHIPDTFRVRGFLSSKTP